MNYKHFTVEEREEIQLGLWQKESVRSLAQRLGRSPSSISREIRRNLSPQRKRYTPRVAHQRAVKKRRRRGREERLKNRRVRRYVVSHLKRRWSPEQISGRIEHDLSEAISHEAIYQFIYAQIHREGRGYVKPGKEDLRPYLRRRRKHRLPPGVRRCQRVLRPKGPSIDHRPTVVGERSRLGDWEGDTVDSIDRKPGINTLVERKTGKVCITKLADHSAKATKTVVTKRLQSLPKQARLTLTLDNGTENQSWPEITRATGATCFYAHPYASWERGSNENTNGLIRDYFPKSTDFTTISHEELAFVERELNNRPRKRLGYLTPNEAWRVALRG